MKASKQFFQNVLLLKHALILTLFIPFLFNAFISTGQTSGTVNLAPSAIIIADPPNGPVPLSIIFNGTRSFDPDGFVKSYSWDFGDGERSSGEYASHAYKNDGRYVVTLTVSDDKGATSSSSITVLAGSAGNCGISTLAPSPFPSHGNNGLAWDGSVVWNTGKVGGDDENLAKFEPDGKLIPPIFSIGKRLVSGIYIYYNFSDVVWDGRFLVGVDGGSLIYMTRQGAFQSDIPITNAPVVSLILRGITWDGTSLWVVGEGFQGTQKKSFLMELGGQGNVKKSVELVVQGIEDLAWDGVALWAINPSKAKLYRIDRDTGALQISCDLPMNNPSGLTWDGVYFWVLTSTSTIHKLLVKPPEGLGPHFKIENFQAPSSINLNQPVTFTVTVKNTSSVGAYQNVSWKVKDDQGNTIRVVITSLALNGFAQTNLSFSHAFITAGSYTVEFATQDDLRSSIVTAGITPTPVRFKGTAVDVASMPDLTKWAVKVEEVLSGDLQIGMQVEVITSTIAGCQGQIGNFQKGDKIEISGEYDQASTAVDVCSSPSYFMRTVTTPPTSKCELEVIDSFKTESLQGLAYAKGALYGWTGSALTKITNPEDPNKRAGQTLNTDNLDPYPKGVGSDLQNLLMINHNLSNSSWIQKIDPATLKSVGAVKVENYIIPDDLAWDGTNYWILGSIYLDTGPTGRVLINISPSGKILFYKAIEKPVGGNTESITSDGVYIYGADFRVWQGGAWSTEMIHRFDKNTGDYLDTCSISPAIPDPDSSLHGIAWDGTYFWASDTEGMVYKLRMKGTTPPSSCGTISTNPRKIIFSNYEWTVSDGWHTPMDQTGHSYWSNSNENVCVDREGRLHLRITKRNDGNWYGGEIRLESALGYGEYAFYLDTNPDFDDSNIILGLFTYKDGNGDGDITEDAVKKGDDGEVDIEFTKAWTCRKDNASYSVQPTSRLLLCTYLRHTKDFSMDLSNSPENNKSASTHKFTIGRQKVSFESIYGHHSVAPTTAYVIATWDYTGSHVPQEDTLRPIINFYMFHGIEPVGDSVEVVVSRFEFYSSGSGFTVKDIVARHSGNPLLVEDEDILWALNAWISGQALPDLGGKVIHDQDILELMDLWIRGQQIRSP